MRYARRTRTLIIGSRGGRGGDKKDDKKRTLFRRRKVCKFCADKIDDINYKDVKLLGPFVPERGKILPRQDLGHLRDASAQAAYGNQASPSAGVDSVRDGIGSGLLA